MRWVMSFGIGMALLAGTAAAQEARREQQQDPGASKPEQQAAVPAKTEPVAAAVTKDNTKAAPEKEQPGEPVIQSRADKLSYAFGIDLARDLQRQKNSLNLDLLMRALTDALAGNKLIMTDEEVAATVKTFEVEQKQDLQHATMMLSERNKREGEAFFADNAKKEGVVTLPSGLQYKILKKGEGKVPTLEDVVLCNYTGKLLDGTEVDSSYKRKEPTAVPVKGLIPGWTQALQLMPTGSKWELYVPPQLAYGNKAGGPIPPYATLIFEVELLSIQDKPQTATAKK
jgi:FKBP-type peptidyl-prolyl cis-trans isomerase FklB